MENSVILSSIRLVSGNILNSETCFNKTGLFLLLGKKGPRRRRKLSKEQKRDLFYTQSEEQVLSSMGSSLDGLSSDEASKRLADYGRNELDEGENAHS